MSLNQRRAWLIAYDIRDPRRLSRLHGFLKRHAVPVQYSVFVFEGHAGHLGAILARIREHIDARKDDVRAYLIPERTEIHVIGRGSLPSSVTLISELGAQRSILATPAECMTMLKSVRDAPQIHVE